MEELLIRNAMVWPHAGAEVIKDGSILIRDGRIAKIGRFKARAESVVDAEGNLVMPGLIQTHIHLCQTIFRGAAEDLQLLPWLKNYIWPLEASHDPASIRASALLSCAELIRGGTTAFMSFETVRHTEHAFQAVAETGLMGILSHCLMDESSGYGPLAVATDDALAYCDDLLEEWEEHDRLRLAVAPRFALACTAANMREAAEYARDRGLLLHTHASEQIPEVELVREQTGLFNIEYLDSIGLSGPDVCLAHCVHTETHERDLLREKDTRVLHCPSTNLKLGSGVAPIPEYLDMGLTISIGADGAPCNNRLDAFEEMRIAGLVQKPRLGPECFPAKEVVKVATEGGAKTLWWGDEMGRLDEGMRANIIIVDQNAISVVGSENYAANVVYGNCASDVLMTIVNGKILFEEGRITTIDEEELRREARKQRKKLFERAGIA
ncbi:MAG: amidohydrolase family protein [Verrucomicrobia bacterium]|nr:amidohydrolase family protein [Verrucomicrobiota bacterium]